MPVRQLLAVLDSAIDVYGTQEAHADLEVHGRDSAMGTFPGTKLIQKYLMYYRLPQIIFLGRWGGGAVS